MRRSLLIAMALLALLGAGWAWRVRRGHGLQGPKVILMDPRPGEGLDPSEAQALGLFLKDHLELRGELSVSSLPTLPDPLPAQVPGSEVLVIQCDANRQGDLLGLDLHFARIPENPGARLGWTDVRIPPRPPAQAIQDGLAALPLRLAPFPPQALLPMAPPAFWDLLRATGGLMSNTSLEDAVMVGRRAVKEAPDCASVHFTVANLAYFQLLQDPLPFDAAEDLMDGAFRKGLAIVPDHPRGLRQYCRLKSDAGRQMFQKSRRKTNASFIELSLRKKTILNSKLKKYFLESRFISKNIFLFLCLIQFNCRNK